MGYEELIRELARIRNEIECLHASSEVDETTFSLLHIYLRESATNLIIASSVVEYGIEKRKGGVKR